MTAARDLERLLRAARGHEIGAELVVVASELAALPPLLGERERLALAALVLAVLVAGRQGSTRLELEGSGPASLRRRLDQVLDAAGLAGERAALGKAAMAQVRGDALGGIVGRGDDYLPLIVDRGALYLQRDLARERRLAANLARKLREPSTRATGLPAAGSAIGGALSDEQRAAVEAAVSRPLTVLAGGPGTGKTATVAAIVRSLCERGMAPEAIALAAPTGKAAHRMAASLARADDAAIARLPAARTLHRLLGYQPAVDRFRHDEVQPIDAAVVIADEASMIDLAMMDRLVRALPAGARLVLVGDPDQLPSVEAGSVLADLVALGERAPELGLVARLTRSYRADPGDPAGRAVLAAAAAVRAGRPAAVRAALAPARPDDLVAPGAAWLELAADDDPAAVADAWSRAAAARAGADAAARAGAAARVVFDFRAGSPPPAQAAVLAELHRDLERARILCGSRRLPGGAEDVNRRCHARVLAGGGLERAELYPGEPVVMRSNDYARGLWNGDTGVVVRGVDRPGERHHFRAAFPRDGGWFSVRVDALRGQLDLAWALTVHQSQGSEYDDVVVVLPPADSPLASRELLYTALTRARRSALVVGSRAALDGAVGRASPRSSGLGERIVDHLERLG